MSWKERSPCLKAQLDRFLLRVRLGYPDKDEEMAILERFQQGDPLLDLKAVADPGQIAGLQQTRKGIHVSHPVREYITNLVGATRGSPPSVSGRVRGVLSG